MFTKLNKIILLAILIHLQFKCADPKNILVFMGLGAYSHKVSIWPLVTALGERGHNVTVISGSTKKLLGNISTVHDLHSTTLEFALNAAYSVNRFQTRLKNKHGNVFQGVDDLTVSTCKNIMQSAGIDDNLSYIVHDGKFDLVITNLLFGEFGYIIAHYQKAKVILYAPSSSFGFLHDELGFRDEPGTITDMRASHMLSYPMTLLDRLVNFFTPIKWFLNRRIFTYPFLEKIISQTYGFNEIDAPTLPELYKNSSLVLLSSHYSNDFARSLPPLFVYVGGMHCWLPTKPIPSEIKVILDNAVSGAILIAFGSTINPADLPDEIMSAFFAMMRNYPNIKFLWRWKGSQPTERLENLYVSPWLPQFEILSHPNLKAFVTHGGLTSLTEATYHGVPLIMLPLFADQDYNAYRMQAAGVGIKLELGSITKHLLISIIGTILNNSSYFNYMKASSALFRDRESNPIETAVYWTEFVLEHDELSSLKPLQDVTFVERRLWDVQVVFVLGLFLSVITLTQVLVFCLNKLNRTNV